MRSIPAFAMVLALAAPLAVAGQPPAPVLGHGIGLSGSIASGRTTGLAPTGVPAAGSLRPFGMRLEYGGMRGGGNGIRVSTVADNAFSLPGSAPAPGIGRTIEATAGGQP